MTKVTYHGEEIEFVDDYQEGEVELDTMDGFFDDVLVAKDPLEDTQKLPSIDLEDTLDLGEMFDEQC